MHDAERTFQHTRRAAQSLVQSAENLEAILPVLRTGKSTAGHFLTDPRPYHRLGSISVRVDSILADFQRRPDDYLDTTVENLGQFPR